MPQHPSADVRQFIQGAPVLQVTDVEATARHYRDFFGFTYDFGDTSYAVVWRENSAIHFVKAEAPASGVRLFQWVADVDALHRELVERGASIVVEPGDRPYGLRDFVALDPNGILVTFGQDSE